MGCWNSPNQPPRDQSNRRGFIDYSPTLSSSNPEARPGQRGLAGEQRENPAPKGHTRTTTGGPCNAVYGKMKNARSKLTQQRHATLFDRYEQQPVRSVSKHECGDIYRDVPMIHGFVCTLICNENPCRRGQDRGANTAADSGGPGTVPSGLGQASDKTSRYCFGFVMVVCDGFQ